MGLGFEQRATVDRLAATLFAHLKAPRASQPRRHGRLCPELDCLRGWLSELTIAAAERRALAVGTGADRVLIAAGLLDEEIYLRLLADSLGTTFETLDTMPRDACPLDDRELVDAPAAGLLPLTIGGELEFVIVPRGLAARHLREFAVAHPELAKRFRLTTASRFQSFVSRHAHDETGRHAADALASAWPQMSAAPPRRKLPVVPALASGALGLAALVVAPNAFKLGCDVVLTATFAAWMVLRIAATLLAPQQPPQRPRVPDDRLPVYTIMVALYREAASVAALIEVLRQLDYPPEKLDIKFIVEADDPDTRSALESLQLAAPFEIIVAPQIGPRTKPKALNAALPFARGTFTVIFDAEDRPEPHQLRDALGVFLAHDDRLACVQASLTIDNTADNWLAGMFTAEYAGQFDVFLPALTKLGVPLPLGGSSNHFRTETLRRVGAWDPYNVTEDADLGVRLARFGYRSVAIPTATYEEAPARFGSWLRQRTRWFKGWMQTWLVHIRQPRRLLRELGLGPFLAVQLIVGGNVLASIVHPLLVARVFAAFTAGAPIWTSSLAEAAFAIIILGGYLASALLGAVGLHRRGLTAHLWVLLLLPVHWLLLALAAWRALYQLLADPYRWEKTDHGLARTTRRPLRASATAFLQEARSGQRFRRRFRAQ
jgi:cellulose synthase/poly-beta-1,6-N-acetylglucosamine synthase-like glycosyltransferase